jgi:hypothetical protein
MTCKVTRWMADKVTEWKRSAFGLLAIAVIGVGALACSRVPLAPGAEEGTLSESSSQNVDPVQIRKNRGGGGGGGGGGY